MSKIIPRKLQSGDEIRVIAPARSLSMISAKNRVFSQKRFESLGLKLTFGQHVEESDDFVSSTIASRVSDLHEAFSDPNVRGIFTVIGGFNSNQLLDYLDWGLIKNNAKILCGYSDITALNNAIFAKTGLVTYSGPHYSTFGQKLHFDYTLEYFKKCLMSSKSFEVIPAAEWTDDQWYLDQDQRQPMPNEGFWVFNQGQAEGTILGANLCTFNLLQGTPYLPDLNNSILFIEDDYESLPHTFDRDLQSLIHLPSFSGVKGLMIGRFQKESHMTRDLLRQIVASKQQLVNLPVIGNVDFGHSDPKITFPIGGTASLSVTENNASLKILEH